MNAQISDQNLATVSPSLPDWEWIVVEEEDWSGVNECGAIFVPDRAMRFEVDDEEWLGWSGC